MGSKGTYTERKNAIKRRRKKRQVSTLTNEDRFLILDRYSKGEPLLDIAEEYIIDYNLLEEWLYKFYSRLVNARETNSLVQAQAYSKSGGYEVKPVFKNPDKVNEEFTSLLSSEEDSIPSEAEMAYATIYSATGDNAQAIVASGLDAGLRGKERDREVMTKLRGVYLRHKPQVAETIKMMQEKAIEALYIDKSIVQNELIHQIKQLKEIVSDRPTQRANLMKAIEMLGKTIPGTFQERIEIHKIDKNMSLSKLVQELQEAEIQELEPGVELLEGGDNG